MSSKMAVAHAQWKHLIKQHLYQYFVHKFSGKYRLWQRRRIIGVFIYPRHLEWKGRKSPSPFLVHAIDTSNVCPMDRLICLNNALWSVNSMWNSEDPTQWYSKVVRIEKVGFPWACLNSFSNIISWPDLTGCIHFDPCFEIAYRFYNSGRIETGPRKSHLFNTDDFAVSLRWVFAVPHRIYWSECVIQADEPVHRTDVWCIYSVY